MASLCPLCAAKSCAAPGWGKGDAGCAAARRRLRCVVGGGWWCWEVLAPAWARRAELLLPSASISCASVAVKSDSAGGACGCCAWDCAGVPGGSRGKKAVGMSVPGVGRPAPVRQLHSSRPGCRPHCVLLKAELPRDSVGVTHCIACGDASAATERGGRCWPPNAAAARQQRRCAAAAGVGEAGIRAGRAGSTAQLAAAKCRCSICIARDAGQRWCRWRFGNAGTPGEGAAPGVVLAETRMVPCHARSRR